MSGRFGTEDVAENGLNHQLVEETTTSGDFNSSSFYYQLYTSSSCLAASGSTGSDWQWWKLINAMGSKKHPVACLEMSRKLFAS